MSSLEWQIGGRWGEATVKAFLRCPLPFLSILLGPRGKADFSHVSGKVPKTLRATGLVSRGRCRKTRRLENAFELGHRRGP